VILGYRETVNKRFKHIKGSIALKSDVSVGLGRACLRSHRECRIPANETPTTPALAALDGLKQKAILRAYKPIEDGHGRKPIGKDLNGNRNHRVPGREIYKGILRK